MENIKETLELKGIKKANILVIGQRDVGKTTLITSIFNNENKRYKTLGIDNNITEMSIKDGFLSIYDTIGFDAENNKTVIDDLLNFINERKSSTDINQHINLVWFCISECDFRIFDTEINLVKAISEFIPVIIIITKSKENNEGFRNKARYLFKGACDVINVRATSMKLSDGHILKQLNIDKLMDISQSVFRMNIKKSIINCQNATFYENTVNADFIINFNSCFIAAAILIPKPYDFIISFIIEIEMLIYISYNFGFSYSEIFSLLFGRTCGTIILEIFKRILLIYFLKFIPIFKSIFKIIVSSLFFILTKKYGNMYVNAISEAFDNKSENKLTVDDVNNNNYIDRVLLYNDKDIHDVLKEFRKEIKELLTNILDIFISFLFSEIKNKLKINKKVKMEN